MGVLGGVALAASWAVAHQIMRGAVPMSQWSLETMGRAVWPPDVTRRFPVIVVAACGAGALADRVPRAARGAMIVGAMAGLAWVLTESVRRTGTSAAAAGVVSVAGAVGLSWAWLVVARMVGRRAPIAWAWRIAALMLAMAAVLLAVGAHSLGLVFLAGTGPVTVLGCWGRRMSGLTVGNCGAGAIAGALGVGLMGAWLAGGWIGLGAMGAAAAAWGALEVRGAAMTRR